PRGRRGGRALGGRPACSGQREPRGDHAGLAERRSAARAPLLTLAPPRTSLGADEGPPAVVVGRLDSPTGELFSAMPEKFRDTSLACTPGCSPLQRAQA